MNANQQPVAIVTGASSGIGLGVTQALLGGHNGKGLATCDDD
jgi:NAD(P)-dependent dehydrogenase (short-subunit alcohol dehydrogenase family)